jgi:hypothetical protein
VANTTCGQCGKEVAGEGRVYCSECESDIRGKKRKRLWFYGIASTILLFAGTAYLLGETNAWDFSWDSLLRRPVAVINGEPIARSEARERLRVTRLMMEKEYGKELFTGERGRAYLGELERDILERMMAERLVAQEARRLNIKVGDDIVKQKIQEIGNEIYGNWESFQASLKEDGISEAYLSAHVRNLLLYQEVKKAKAPDGADPDAVFDTWLAQGRQGAKITLSRNVGFSQASSQRQDSCCPPGRNASGGGCGGRGGTGCGTKQSGPLDPRLKSEASAAALAAYQKTHPADKDVAVEVTDFGCHVQVDIQKEGKVVRSYSYLDGKVVDN